MTAQEKLKEIREKLKSIVVTDGCDKGVVLLSAEGTCHYDKTINGQVYDHEYFSPLGDALIELYHLCISYSSE